MRESLSGLSTYALGMALASACVTDPVPPDPPPEPRPTPVVAPPAKSLAVTCPDRNTLKNAYFGDLHTHQTLSSDAYTFETRTPPMDAYAFAKGMRIQIAGAHP